jgi:hypothetical protein
MQKEQEQCLSYLGLTKENTKKWILNEAIVISNKESAIFEAPGIRYWYFLLSSSSFAGDLRKFPRSLKSKHFALRWLVSSLMFSEEV